MSNKLQKSVLGSNYVKDYIDKNIRSIYKNPKDLYFGGKNALVGVLMNSNDPILRGVEPKLVRGAVCELMLQYSLEYFFSETDYNYGIFNNLLLYNNFYGSTTQLDSVVLTNNCILVIECKSLYGESIIEDGIIWTKYGKTSQEVTKTTPWKQNMSHILTLKDELGKLNMDFNNCFYVNMVFVFGIGRIIKYVPENNKVLATTNNDNILPILNQEISKSRRVKIDNSSLKSAFKYLNSKTHNIEDEIQHIQNLERR